MACRLFGTKTLPEPGTSLNQCWLIANWTLGNKVRWNLKSKFIHFHSRKCNWKCCLLNWRPFCPWADELCLHLGVPINDICLLLHVISQTEGSQVLWLHIVFLDQQWDGQAHLSFHTCYSAHWHLHINNGHWAEDIFKQIFWAENFYILIHMPLGCIPRVQLILTRQHWFR